MNESVQCRTSDGNDKNKNDLVENGEPKNSEIEDNINRHTALIDADEQEDKIIVEDASDDADDNDNQSELKVDMLVMFEDQGAQKPPKVSPKAINKSIKVHLYSKMTPN